MDVLSQAWEWILEVYDFMEYYISYLWSAIVYVWDTLVSVAVNLWNDILWVVGKVWSGLHALGSISFSSIWAKIKTVFGYYKRFRAWWQKYIQGPLDQYRRQILAIYRQYFKPIIQVIETLRVGLRIIAVFDRKLAAKLDAKLWALEAWVLTPITLAMRRVNGMASILYAILTATGRFDATVFVSTVARHIGEIRAAVFGLPFKQTTSTLPDPLLMSQQTALDFHNWVHSGGTPIQDGVDVMDSAYQQAWTLFGG